MTAVPPPVGAPAPTAAPAPATAHAHAHAHAHAPPTRRLFLALWPDAAACRALAAWRDAWPWPVGVRLTPPGQWHLTLHFLGAVPADALPRLAPALAVAAPAVTVTFDHAACWRGGLAVLESPADLRAGDAPRSATTGGDGRADDGRADDGADLRALHAALARAIAAAGLPVETRPYRPHLTLARHAAGAEPPAATAPLPPVRWRADRYVLVASADQRYEILRGYPLSRS